MERGQILFWHFGELSDSNQSIKSSISMDDIMDIINESSDDLMWVERKPRGGGERGAPGAAHRRPGPHLGTAGPGGWGFTTQPGAPGGDGTPGRGGAAHRVTRPVSVGAAAVDARYGTWRCDANLRFRSRCLDTCQCRLPSACVLGFCRSPKRVICQKSLPRNPDRVRALRSR